MAELYNWDCPQCGQDPEDCYCGDEEPAELQEQLERLTEMARIKQEGDYLENSYWEDSLTAEEYKLLNPDEDPHLQEPPC